jgi:uncharacterized membrane protein
VIRLFQKDRFVVVNLFVAVDDDAVAPVRDAAVASARRIVEADGDFDVARAEIGRVARVLLDHESSWSHAAHGGDVFDREEDAAAQGDASFADLSTRYLAGDDDEGHAAQRNDADALGAEPGVRRAVVMFTLAYAGEEPALENDVGGVLDVRRVLQAVVSLAEQDRLLLAHIHAAPAHPEDTLTEERLLVGYPELMSL